MPFTLAHPAVLLLLRRTSLPVAAMVAGALSPDVPVYLNAYGWPYHLTHSAVGVVTLDLALGLVAVTFWFSVLRDPVVDVLPAVLRERLDPRARYDRGQWRLAAPAVLAGSTTHVAWDQFTHHDRWGVRQIAWLHAEHGSLEGYKWAQYGSSILGLTVCTLWAAKVLRDRELRSRPVLVPRLGVRALLVVAGLTVAAGLAAGITAPDPGVAMFFSQTAVVGTLVGAFLIVVLALAWNVLRSAGGSE